MERWLIAYDATSNVQHFLDRAKDSSIAIVGVYPAALSLVAEGTRQALQSWIATLSVRSTRTGSFAIAEIEAEVNPDKQQLMNSWNQYLDSSPQKTHPHEGLPWDHPGLLPPDGRGKKGPASASE